MTVLPDVFCGEVDSAAVVSAAADTAAAAGGGFFGVGFAKDSAAAAVASSSGGVHAADLPALDCGPVDSAAISLRDVLTADSAVAGFASVDSAAVVSAAGGGWGMA